MKKKKAILISVTAIIVWTGILMAYVPEARLPIIIVRGIWWATFEKNKHLPVDYRNYVPGNSDDERWTWVSQNMQTLTQANREQLKKLLPQKFAVNNGHDKLVFRITQRLENEEAFSDKFWALYIHLDDANRVNRLEIIHVETQSSNLDLSDTTLSRRLSASE